ncbi:MAG: tRNA (adenosine(37)-N6)-threonylcarbamoyltransferase complex ATPase subunit type 1 TsaE [Firmicutes bacterium]|nr:tRNA (adenosine(37)-N6)-threonylcarbamoyltransferase complex ATPase subunit type 1 TsaE [Bacillota bacterium]
MKDIIRTITIENEEGTRAFGLELAANAKPGDVIALIGDLGTGKTALTRYIAEGLGITGRISSPTFTIVKEYHSGRLPLYHFDVYRLAGDNDILSGQEISGEAGKAIRERAIDELYNIGADEYFEGDGLTVIEWADLIEEALPDNTGYVFMEYGEGETQRIYRCTF